MDGLGVKVKLELINNFYPTREARLESKTTRDLSIEEARALYRFLSTLIDKLEVQGREFWKKKQDTPAPTFACALKEIIDESDNGLIDLDWEYDEEDWYIGE
jgi:hypothetical protein